MAVIEGAAFAPPRAVETDSMILLASDIGGTKTDLALFSPERGPGAPLAEVTFPSVQYPSLEALAQEFLGRARSPVSAACFGVAGPGADALLRPVGVDEA